MLRRMLIICGSLHSLIMLGTTFWASFQDSILNQGHLFKEAWFLATLTDTYLAFLLFYCWVFVVTPKWYFRLIHLVGVICLGNIMMGCFIAYRAYKMPHLQTMRDFLVGVSHD